MQRQNTSPEVRKANIKCLERMWAAQPRGYGFIEACRHDGRRSTSYILNTDAKHLSAFCEKYSDFSIWASPLTFKIDEDFGRPFRSFDNMLRSRFVWGTHPTPKIDGVPLDQIGDFYIWGYPYGDGADADTLHLCLEGLGGRNYRKDEVLHLLPIAINEPTWRQIAVRYRVAMPMKAPPPNGDRSAGIMWITGLMIEYGASAHDVVKVLPHSKPFQMKFGDNPHRAQQELKRIHDKITRGEFSRKREEA